MMKFIAHYKELGTDDKRSVFDHISKNAIPAKDAILEYLNGGEDAGVRCSSIFDHVQKISTGETICVFTDGEYKWDSEEIYHFEKYNMELDAAFVEKVLAA